MQGALMAGLVGVNVSGRIEVDRALSGAFAE